MWKITYLWKKIGKWKSISQYVQAVSRDNAIMCGRYRWLAILAAEGVPDPEVVFEQDFKLIQVVEKTG
jgi:hypothetical protein